MALRIGIQLFSVGEQMEKDPKGTLKALADMGYVGIETCGSFYGMEPCEFKAVCDEYGLKIISAHVWYPNLVEETEKTISLYKSLGTEYLAIASLWGDLAYGKKDPKEGMANLNTVCPIFKENGLQVLYHNHDGEFEKDNGKYHLDYIFDGVDEGLIMPEIDTCWAAVGHGDVSDLLRRYDGRCPVIHLKDMYCRGAYGFENTKGERPEGCAVRPVGYGRLDIIDIIHTEEEIGTKWIIIEQDSPSFGLSRLECAALCREWLKKQGW